MRLVPETEAGEALERQERERGRELDDLLAALDVELSWQRDVLAVGLSASSCSGVR